MGNDAASGRMAWSNRLSDNMYKAYATLLGTEKVVVSLDRYGIMRPTKDIAFPNEEGEPTIEDRPKWRTQDKWYILFISFFHLL